MSITAIVPVWNGRDLLGSPAGQPGGADRPAAEMLVVDNGSTDGAPELAAQPRRARDPHGPQRRFRRGRQPRHSARPAASWIAVLNSDVELAPDYFARLAGAGRRGRLVRHRQDSVAPATPAASTAPSMWCAAAARPGASATAVPTGRRFPWRNPSGPRPGRPRCSAPSCSGARGCWRRFRIVSGGRGFRLALRRARAGRALRARRRRLASRQRHAGPLASGDGAAHRAQPGVAGGAALSRATLRGNWWPILVAQLLWGAVALRHGAGAAWLRGKWQGLRRISAERARCAAGRPRTYWSAPVRTTSGPSAKCSRPAASIFTGGCTFFSPAVRQSDTWRTSGSSSSPTIRKRKSAPCLDAALATGADVVVVDNASRRRHLAEVARPRRPADRQPRQPGLRRRRKSRDYSVLKSPYVLLLNPDAVICGPGSTRCAQACDLPGAAGAGGCLMGAEGRPQIGFMVRAPAHSRGPGFGSIIAQPDLAEQPGQPALSGIGAGLFRASRGGTAGGRVSDDPPGGVGGIGRIRRRFRPLWFEDVDFCRQGGGRGIFPVLDAGSGGEAHRGALDLADCSGDARCLLVS